MRLTAFFLAAAAAIPLHAASAAGADCAGLLPTEEAALSARPLLPEDLVALRDIGPVDPGSRVSPIFTLSPDGGRVAFQLRRADAASNRYCLAMVVLDLNAAADPTLVDTGGELLLLSTDTPGKVGMPTGIMLTITPRWAPDGSWIAFLKREGGTTQVWRADAGGGGSAPLTQAPSDVVDFRISEDGTTLLYATRPGLEEARGAIAREALTGFHYDDRFAPAAADTPFPPPPIPRRAFALDVSTGTVRSATAGEAAALGAPSSQGERQGLSGRPSRPSNVWISQVALTGGASSGALHADRGDGRTRTCPAPECTGATDPWWVPGGSRVRFLRREGWGRASTAIYEWDPDGGAVRRIYRTGDVLVDCTPSGAALICLRVASLQARRLERLDPKTGERELLFDPNPGFANLALGRVERLHWRNSFGIEVLGDLVLPTDYRVGERYPLVVVQYDTRGFLRGGTGDEYPIQAFANRGYAVLSVSRPQPVGLHRGARTLDEVNRLDLEDFADRRSALSALEEGVELAIAKGVADPARIGITGFSDGASQTISALLHSRLFAAAAMSSCCVDTTFPTRVGPAAARSFYEAGFPRMTDRKEGFWKQISLSLNARRVRTPTLLQLADTEYLSALESYTALREVGAPFDMFVFPGEYHVKWQPAHRLAIYRRALDWFDFWLRGVRSQAPERQVELHHWDTLSRSSPQRS